MGKKNRRKRHIHNEDGLGALRQQCPLCGANVWKCFGSRNDQAGQWNICVNNHCKFDEFVANDKSFTATNLTGKKKNKVSVTQTGSSGTGTAVSYSRKCNHWRDKVKVGEHKVTVSALSDKPGALQKDYTEMPGLGVYLAFGWQDKMSPIWGAGYKTPHGLNSHPAVYTKWPDYGVVDISVVEWLVKAIRKNMAAGLSVDIGCQGGHGRTGTLLACLIADVEGIGSDDAIKAVHKRHCTSAVESISQENLVREYCGEEPIVVKQVPVWRMYIQGHRLSYNMTSPRR